ncbi:MAG: hypothetical protein R3B90_17145 [Planctomycetaceae bacterium]
MTIERGQRMEFDGIVTRHDEPYAHSVHLVGAAFDIDVDYLFERTDVGTQVTQIATVHGKGMFRVLFKVMGWFMSKGGHESAAKELRRLKDFCEGRPL